MLTLDHHQEESRDRLAHRVSRDQQDHRESRESKARQVRKGSRG